MLRGKTLKFLLIAVPALWFTSYIAEKTYHELEIPRTEHGEKISISISDESLEDAIGEVLQIPLRFFPRELCFKNRNRIFVNGEEISESLYRESDAGTTNTYIDYPNGHSVKLLTTRRLKENCTPVKIPELVGATTTMNVIFAASVRIDLRTTPLPTSFKIENNTDNSRLYSHITPTGLVLLFVSAFFAMGSAVLLLMAILKFILEDQFPNLKIDSEKICRWICRT